jgi:hypothetical protein
MDSVSVIEKKFSLMGARVKISEPNNRRWNSNPRPFSIDIGRDEEGEFFSLQVKKEVEMMIMDVQKKDRHLLLLVKDPNGNQGFSQASDPRRTATSRFLCGHDERHWFTCAVPGGASTVVQAKQNLKPTELQNIEQKEGLKANRAHKRHRKLESGRKVHRQGEFMFIPEPYFQPPVDSLTVIHRNEPMSRGRGQSHFAEFLYRSGGTRVYVSSFNDKSRTVGLTEKEFKALSRHDQHRPGWQTRQSNAQVWVKGKIRHHEHRTLDLGTIWHRVVVNTETTAPGAMQVAFLD